MRSLPHLFCMNPLVDQKVNELIEDFSDSGEARHKLSMPSDVQGTKGFAKKNFEA